MGKARELRARIKSVRNTRKITRTMELVATAKAKVTQTRLKAVVPYSQTLLGMVSQLAASGARHPLLADAAATDLPGATVIFGITANRGLCGGYNTNVIRLVRETLAAERAAGRTPEVYLAGKKGIASLKFLKVPLAQAYTQFDDKPTFEAVAAVAEPLLARFAAGAVRRVEICSCRYVSSAQQRPERVTWLPITPPPLAKRPAFEPLLHPDRDQLLSKLLPLVATAGLFQAFVEAAACEQIARRIAMKAATDNADDMIRSLNQTYNRARQAGITQEIAEVIGGAAALE